MAQVSPDENMLQNELLSKNDGDAHQQSMIRRLSFGLSEITWPAWSAMARPQERTGVTFQFRIEPDIFNYIILGTLNVDPKFRDAANAVYAMRFDTARDPTIIDITDRELVLQITMFVYSSNVIDGIGCSQKEICDLCQAIFLDNEISSVPVRSFEYYRRVELLVRQGTEDETRIRQRYEVVNHAIAFMYMVNNIVRNNKPFSEDIIKESHAFLCSRISVMTNDNEIIQSNAYAGLYRTHDITTDKPNPVAPAQISTAMENFVLSLNDRLYNGEDKHELTLSTLRLLPAEIFSVIHPFINGNGRICRFILNTILLKYIGGVCPFGEHKEERDAYHDIIRHRSEWNLGSGELALFVLRRCVQLNVPWANVLRT